MRSGFLLKLYADDLILCGEFVEEVIESSSRLKRFNSKSWKNEGYAAFGKQKECVCKD